MIGGNLDELILQIPLNFPKQRTEVPPYYKNTDGSLVVRFNVLLENCNWENILNDYNPTNYTSPIVLYHDILKLNKIDETYKEFNPRTKKMEWVKRGGWVATSSIKLDIS